MIDRSLTLKRQWNSCKCFLFHKVGHFPLYMKHAKEGDHCINYYYHKKKNPCWILMILYNSAIRTRTSPETIALLTKQFPRWSLIIHWFNEFLKKFWAKLLITRSSLHSHMQVYTLESGSTYFTYQVKFCVCVLWHISETSAYFWLKCSAPYSEWDYSRIDGKLPELCLFHPLYIHANCPG